MLEDHPGAWTEAEYLALGETINRYELIDGGLWVSPAANSPHQDISFLLMTMLWPAARKAGLRPHLATNVRLAAERIMIPDLVAEKGHRVTTVADAGDVVLVAEITSPSNAAVDRVQKMHFYAAAGIPAYLLVEPDMGTDESIRLRLFRLQGEHYLEHAAAENGETLVSDFPFPISVHTAGLLDF